MFALDTSSTFGYAGVIANLIWPTFRARQFLLIGQIVACCLMLTHFVLLGATSGAAVMGVAGIQALLAIPLGRHPNFKRVYFVSMVLTPLVCFLTWQGNASIFSSAAMALFAFANLQTEPVKQRALLILVITAWFVHNTLSHSIPGLVSNTLALIVSLRMLCVVQKEGQQPVK
jgi:hypothetical protein